MFARRRRQTRHVPTHPPVKFRAKLSEYSPQQNLNKMSSALFKASTAAFSSRSLARSIPAFSPFSRRRYSANSTPEQESEEKKEDEKLDDKSTDIAEKLKAKEAEVIDLTVSCFILYSPSYFILTISTRDDFATCRQTFLISSGTLHARRNKPAILLSQSLQVTSLKL